MPRVVVCRGCSELFEVTEKRGARAYCFTCRPRGARSTALGSGSDGPLRARDGRGRFAATLVARACAVCGKPTASPKYRCCSYACSGEWVRANRPRKHSDEATQKSRRRAAERDAGGLAQGRRLQLLERWRRQGRACLYCGGAAETVEHVVPITRGGTNFEGNLVPACRACNASKCDRLLMEWTGRPGVFATWPRAATAASQPRQRSMMCATCNVTFVAASPRRYCQSTCWPNSGRAVCDFDGCARLVAARGLCDGHDDQRKAGRELSPLRHYSRRATGCSMNGCAEPVAARGLCTRHYHQHRAGHPLVDTVRCCECCGQSFEATRTQQRFCKDKCRRRNARREQRRVRRRRHLSAGQMSMF